MRIQEYIAQLATGKTVLDVGCVMAVKWISTDDWLHAHLLRTAKSVVGLDSSKKGVAALRQRGYDIVLGDATSTRLGRHFDVIVAGELIEHVDNAGALIRNLAAHLAPGGRLVVTTPNILYLLHSLEGIFSDPSRRWCWQHVACYEAFTLCNLIQRCGLKIEEASIFRVAGRFDGCCGACVAVSPGP